MSRNPVGATAYAGLGDDEQAEGLRPVAVAAAAEFDLDVVRLEVVAHAYNTTFEIVTGDGGRYALRINTNSKSTVGEILAQQAWQLAIAAETPVRVPVPRTTRDGTWCARIGSEVLGRELLVTCAGWLEGSDVVEPVPEQTHALGRTMALLHGHARGWVLPEGASMRVYDDPIFGDEDRLTGAPGLAAEQHEVLRRADELAQDAYAQAQSAGPVLPLHADLHGGNLKWHEGRLAVFDFDDCGLGAPALDLAISTFYLRGEDGAALEAALREGYAEVAPLPDLAPEVFEALVASRQLLLGNDLLGSSTAGQRRRAQDYLVTTVDRLRHWLRTGRFTRSLPTA